MESYLVPVGDHADMRPVVAGMRIITSFPSETTEGKLLTYRAQQQQDFSIDSLAGESDGIENVVMHGITMTDEETGESRTEVRTVLITPDGRRYGGVSQGVVQSVLALSRMFGSPPWRPPLKVRLVAVKTRRGRTYHTLDIEG